MMDMKCMSHSTTNSSKPNTARPCITTSTRAMVLRGRRGESRAGRMDGGPAAAAAAEGGRRRAFTPRARCAELVWKRPKVQPTDPV